jgi:pimeloyl-ACP methyl ester carboxylesterase
MPERETTIDVNGLSIHYAEHGSGPPLLLLHGGLSTGASWAPTIPFLAEHYRVIVPDSRGHGRTSNPGDSLNYREMAGDMLALGRALELSRPAIVGWSDGGQIALEIGIIEPSFASALVACGVLYTFSEHYLSEARGYLCADEFDEAQPDAFAERFPNDAEHMRRQHATAADPEHWQVVMRQVARLWLTPFGLTEERMASIVTPTLIASADHDVMPLEEALAMVRSIPQAELAIFPGARHDVPVTRPQIFAATVLDFLERRSL